MVLVKLISAVAEGVRPSDVPEPVLSSTTSSTSTLPDICVSRLSICILTPSFNMDARLRRVNKEIAGESCGVQSEDLVLITPCVDCKNDKTSKVTIELVDSSPYHLIGSFDGPEGTPYEGGHFKVVRLLFLDQTQPLRLCPFTRTL